MTSSPPPQPPLGGQPPQPGQQPPPGYAASPPGGYDPPPPSGYAPPPPSGYAPPPPSGPPGYPQQPPPGYAQQPPPPGYGAPQPAQNPFAHPQGTGSGVSFDAAKLTMAAYVIAGLTLLYLILSFFTWYAIRDVGLSFSGWTSGQVKMAFFLFLLASVWALLPAFTDLRLGFPRSWITVALAALGWLLTLVAWIDSLRSYFGFSYDFSIWALLGMVVATALLVFSVLTLLPELRTRPGLPGGLASAAQWANQPAPEFGPRGAQRPAGQQVPPQPYGQPPQQPGQQFAPPPPPAPRGTPSYGPPAGDPAGPPYAPPEPGGATASGEGSPER